MSETREEAAAYRVKWRERGIDCTRVYESENAAMKWAQELSVMRHYGPLTIEAVEVEPLFPRAALKET